jgi:hypothetical protein
VVFSAAPTVSDDMNSYSVGTVWIDTSAATVYILVDNTSEAAVWTIAAAPGPVTYAIGDTGPAGGIVFSITDGGLHGLEAATEDLPSTAWGCGADITGANGTAVGTGEQNTAAIIAAAACPGTTAASVAAAYGQGWFLPSKDELDLMWEHLADPDGDDSNSGPGDSHNVGGFASNAYWSSSQSGSANAFYQYFDDGVQGDDDNKNLTNGVRAVRAF